MLENELELSTPTLSKEPVKPIGPGSRLRKIREARHLSLEEMAKRIRLTPERLEQIENDTYILMGAPAFAKGYLRSYANQLGLAKEEILSILQAFDELNLGADIQHNKPELIDERLDHVSPKTTRWFSFLILFLIVVSVGAYLWHNHLHLTIEKPAAETADTTHNGALPATDNTSLSTSDLQILPPQPILPDATTTDTATDAVKTTPKTARPARKKAAESEE